MKNSDMANEDLKMILCIFPFLFIRAADFLSEGSMLIGLFGLIYGNHRQAKLTHGFRVGPMGLVKACKDMLMTVCTFPSSCKYYTYMYGCRAATLWHRMGNLLSMFGTPKTCETLHGCRILSHKAMRPIWPPHRPFMIYKPIRNP